MIVIFDLDQTLVNTDVAFAARKQGRWGDAYRLIPQMNKYPLIDQILNLLRSKNANLALVSSSPKEYCNRVINHFGFQFDVVVGYHDTSQHKPNPQPYLKAITTLQGSNGRTYAVGDDSKDIIAARSLGLISVGCGWGSYDIQNLKDSKPDHYFSKPEELLTFFNSDIG